MSDTIAQHQPSRLVSSDRVDGTTVYDLAGDKLGTIRNFMVEKHSGIARYAILDFGGFFGSPNDRYPIPWDMLDYNTEKDGYVVSLDKSQLNDAPRYSQQTPPAYDDRYARNVSSYWGDQKPLL